MGELRIGTCSWKYPSWRGLVYSGSDNINYLEEYAEHYNTVEIDRWFWSLFGEDSVALPRPDDVENYRRSVPDDFVFTVKAPNSITLTHYYRKRKTEPMKVNPHFLSPSLLHSFLSLLEPLGNTLGPVLFQFGYLNKMMVDSQKTFQEQLQAFGKHFPSGYQYGVEVRNAQYLNASYFEFLLDNRLIPVLLEGYWMPPVTRVFRDWRDLLVQHETLVIRLLGPDRKGIEKQTGKRWNRIVAPKDEELSAIVDLTEDLRASGLTVYLNVNNHYEGSAPLTIERVRSLLDNWPRAPI
ncbi:MAG: DUF72 domain-containing protein [Anaerolineae bacterium]|jgi:uncharacterized protein YecE (DUF72 family)